MRGIHINNKFFVALTKFMKELVGPLEIIERMNSQYFYQEETKLASVVSVDPKVKLISRWCAQNCTVRYMYSILYTSSYLRT